MASTLLRNFQRVTQGEGFALIARHIGCETVALRRFYLGREDALNNDQQLLLAELIQDMFDGYTPRGGFYTVEDGSTKWKSKIERE